LWLWVVGDSCSRGVCWLVGWLAMWGFLRVVLLAVLAGVVVAAVGGCGGLSGAGSTGRGSSGVSARVSRVAGGSAGGLAGGGGRVARLVGGEVAVVGGHVIGDGLLGEWMREELGEAFYTASGGRVAPVGLVSEPADIPACDRLLAAPGGAAGQTPAQIEGVCRKLYRAVKIQALGYLVSSFWALDFAAAHGVKITAGDIDRGLAQFVAQQYPGGGGEFQRAMSSKRRTLAQERFIERNDLVSRALLPRIEAGSSSAIYKEALADAETAACPAAYIVEHCQGYATSPVTPTHPSAIVMLEEISNWLAQASTHKQPG
jgi:hypothetical protein